MYSRIIGRFVLRCAEPKLMSLSTIIVALNAQTLRQLNLSV